MDQELANFFFEQAARAFDFLVDSDTFGPPHFEVDNQINFAMVTFMAHHLAVQCILDERAADIDCKVARLCDGRETQCYAFDAKGVRVRERLFTLLVRRGVRERLFTRTTSLDLHDKIRVTLSDFANMLRKHGRDILADSPDALS